MRRFAPGLLLAALLVVVLPLMLAGCGGADAPSGLPRGPAPPVDAVLDWRERTPETGPGLTFSVQRFRITTTGWDARIGIRNGTAADWRLAGTTAEEKVDAGSAFGVMVLPSDDLADLGQTNGSPPPVRPATRIAPPLPAILAPGAAWEGTVSGSGRLPAGLYVRISFGPIWTTGEPPAGLSAAFTWVTDHALSLGG